MSRREELAERLAAVEGRIAAACEAAGRSRDEVQLIVVTKFFPRSDVDLLAELGMRDLGENREQEAAAKLADGGPPSGVRTHFIGQLQSNKAGAVTRWADVVQSVDRPKLVGALARGAEAAGRKVTALVQVDLDPAGGTGRGGAAPADVPALADAIASSPLRLGGLMAVAPLGADPEPAFARLAALAEALRADHPEASWISAGMSGDLEAAVRHGATHLRVGTAILGDRPSHR
ncbi:YggS family pyridoxal phosphate-dependent enzyme [Janibacter sp. YB324]|uniref:YggS family pyridoxal phosphate-dependent enzyme n=1 Tax=Janibacter sp. YB324 TaxID=2761047 RepID=UPI001628661D|nr:YggS family pyridoxal phosphate-dependent enzyme [Janibacter sp. YB324]QNF95287.1 YggS family pyridoxal phosphate-dependent enzyme [Janibacter sp. YB324]